MPDYWNVVRRVVQNTAGSGRPRQEAGAAPFAVVGEVMEFELTCGYDMPHPECLLAQTGSNWAQPFNMVVQHAVTGHLSHNAAQIEQVRATREAPRLLRYQFRTAGLKRLVFRGTAATVTPPTRTVSRRPQQELLFPPVELSLDLEVVENSSALTQRLLEPAQANMPHDVSRQEAVATTQGTASHAFRQWELAEATRRAAAASTPSRRRPGLPVGLLDFDLLDEPAISNMSEGEYLGYLAALNAEVRATPPLDLRPYRQNWVCSVNQRGSVTQRRFELQTSWRIQEQPSNYGVIYARPSQSGAAGLGPAVDRAFNDFERQTRHDTSRRYRLDSWVVVQVAGASMPALVTPRALLLHQNIDTAIEILATVFGVIDFLTLPVSFPMLGVTAAGRGLRALIRRAAQRTVSRVAAASGRRAVRETGQLALELADPANAARGARLLGGNVDDTARGIGRAARAASGARETAAALPTPPLRRTPVPEEVYRPLQQHVEVAFRQARQEVDAIIARGGNLDLRQEGSVLGSRFHQLIRNSLEQAWGGRRGRVNLGNAGEWSYYLDHSLQEIPGFSAPEDVRLMSVAEFLDSRGEWFRGQGVGEAALTAVRRVYGNAWNTVGNSLHFDLLLDNGRHVIVVDFGASRTSEHAARDLLYELGTLYFTGGRRTTSVMEVYYGGGARRYLPQTAWSEGLGFTGTRQGLEGAVPLGGAPPARPLPQPVPRGGAPFDETLLDESLPRPTPRGGAPFE